MRMKHMEDVAACADRLEDWLGKNAGTNADWPVALKCHDVETADTLSELLTDLKKALAPYREALKQKPAPTTPWT
jgi:hypothetical protein